MIPTDHDGGVEAPQTVVVGVKMDALSRELLTWSLVKVAQPGDVVLALHVLAPNEIFDTDGKSSLLSLVKAFDSVLGVYEGFCNLKQVDLKLKICRGSSVRKIIVREANLCAANKVIVGTAVKHHTIRSCTSVAKYCAKKLPKDCSVLAVRNGKVVFQREATASAAGKRKDSKGANDQHNSILEGLQRSSTINSILNNEDAAISPKTRCDEVHEGINADLEQTRLKIDALRPEMVTTQTCCICSHSFSSDSSLPCTSLTEERGDNIINHQEDNSKALVPFQKSEAASSSVSLLVKELPELRPGWPLLRRRLLAAREGSTSSSRDISIVQWATSLPSRHCMSTVSSSTEKNREEHDADSCDHGVHSNAMVPFNSEIQSHTLDEDSKSALRELEGLHERYSTTCRSFKYEELQSATSNFMPENLIGKGGSSWVYRGTLSDGKELAVKILKPSEDVLQEFMMEIEIITSLHHKNIISLLGFCFEDSDLLLVYDLLSRGSLEENLHGDKKNPAAFGCNQRFKVALGVAEALYYLHNKNTPQIIHRDVKSSNILLSEDFEPKLSDFGFAKWASTSSHITCTDVAGTFGYLAPEYFMYGKVTDKIDVFAFGVVLLELLSGRRPISNELPKGEESLVMWARPILNGGKVSKLLDPCLSSNNNQDQIERMVLAATLCIRRAPRARPHMRVILKLLQGDLNTVKWARLQVNASDNIDKLDDDGLPQIDLQSHLSLALLDVEDDSLSMSSLEQHVSLEDYLRGRWSRSSSLD